MNIRKQLRSPQIKTIGMIVFFLFSIVVLTYLLFIGGVSRYSGIRYIDRVILQKALKGSSRIDGDVSSSKIKIVSFNEKDFNSGRVSHSKYLLDASSNEYRDVILKIVDQNPRAIFISILRPAHEGENLAQIDGLIDTASEFKDRIFIVDSLSKIWSYSFNKIQTVLDFQCGRGRNLKCEADQLEKSVFSKIENIFPQHGKKTDSYILNIYPDSKLLSYSFCDVKEGKGDFRDSVVFLGNDIVQKEFVNEKDDTVVKRVQTLDDQTKSLYESTPGHIYLARVARMLEQNRLVATSTTGPVFMILFICVIFYLCIKRRFLVSILIIGTISYLSPAINSKLIDSFKTYLDFGWCIYLSTLLVLVTGIVFYFYFEFKNERLNQQSLLRQKSFKLKSNFISLISHNLNTPVSRLYSLLTVATMSGWTNKRLEQNISGMFFTVKFALAMRAVKESRGVEKAWSLDQIVKDFEYNMVPVLKNLGICGIKTRISEDVDSGSDRFLCNETVVELVVVACLSTLKITGFLDDKSKMELMFVQKLENKKLVLEVEFNLENSEDNILNIIASKELMDKMVKTSSFVINKKLILNYLDMCRSKNVFILRDKKTLRFEFSRS